MITLQERVHAAPKPDDWQLDKLHQVFRVRRGHKNAGMKEDNLLSLSYGRIIQKDIDTADGLLPENFEGYQIVEPGNIVLRLTDLQNDKRSLRQGLVTQRGIITSAYDAVEIQRDNDPRFWFYSLLALDLAKHYYSLGGGVRQSVKFADFPNDWVYRPDLATQRQIADFLDRETARIDLLIEKKQRLVALLGEKARSVINQATTIGFRECEMQDSGEKWLGKVAAHWRVTPLKWFTRLQSGYAFKADRFGDIGTRLVRMNNLKRGALDLEEAVCIADEEVNTSVMLRAGDILLGMSGSIGETGSLGNFAVVTEEDLPCLLNQRVGRFQFVGDELLPDYLKLVIQSASFLDPVFLAATSTAQFNVSPSQVGTIMFALPPLIEQQELVQEVARRNVGFNKVRERSLASIDRLKEYRSALITAAVTGQIDVTTYAKSSTPDRRLDAIQKEMGA